MKALCRLALILALAVGLQAEEVLIDYYGCYLDIPEGWSLLDARNPDKISFTDGTRSAVFQIMGFPSGRFADARDLARFVGKSLAAKDESSVFVHRGGEAVLADLTFRAGKHDARGYGLFLSGGERDYALLAFAGIASYESRHDELLSCLDSFSQDAEARRAPGPISSFLAPCPPPAPERKEVRFGVHRLGLMAGRDEEETNQVLIEREARVLASAKGNFAEAWKRHYRAIYRDSYPRLAPLAGQIAEVLTREGKGGEKLPAALLSWFQNFTYTRRKSLSDFQSPLTCVLTSSGDCDSLGLAYVILLRALGYDAVLLVSSRYGHAMAAVDVPGTGARIAYKGKRYLVAELTDKVNIGLIDRAMADPAGWIPVAFEEPVEK